MQKDEVPPEHLWEDSVGLEQWWKYIKDKRDDGSDSPASTRLNRSASEDEDGEQQPGMAENEVARYLKQG